MARARYLPNAPITEGLIDFRVRTARELTPETLEQLEARLRGSYAEKGSIVQQEVNFGAPDGTQPARVVAREVGARFHSEDEKHVAQFQHEGFTLSRLAPYAGWESLKSEAGRLWTIYVELAGPEAITRVACRFINNLRLPLAPGQDLAEFLTASPQIPPALPQVMLAYMQRVVIAHPELNARTVLTQMLDPNAMAATNAVPVILDIDVQCEQEFSPNGPEVWERLEQLREMKNKVFFECLTERAVELYR